MPLSLAFVMSLPRLRRLSCKPVAVTTLRGQKKALARIRTDWWPMLQYSGGQLYEAKSSDVLSVGLDGPSKRRLLSIGRSCAGHWREQNVRRRRGRGIDLKGGACYATKLGRNYRRRRRRERELRQSPMVALQMSSRGTAFVFYLRIHEGRVLGVSKPLRELLTYSMRFHKGKCGTEHCRTSGVSEKWQTQKRLKDKLEDGQSQGTLNMQTPLKCAKNSGTAIMSGVSTSAPRSSNLSDFETRLEICGRCEHAELDRRIGIVRLCRKCGCAIAAKAYFESLHCPIGKW